jgi:excisionase family DNA binding protein
MSDGNIRQSLWLTTQQAADMVGYHADHIRRLIRAGEIQAEKFGPVWKVDGHSLQAYVRRMAGHGERRGPKPRD